MKIALAQMEVVAGRPKKTLERMLHIISEAKNKGVDLIAFPEMCVGGYLLGDLWTNEGYCRALMKFNEKIMQASKGIAIAYGNIYVDDTINERVGDDGFHPNKDGRVRKYNAIYVYQNGKPAKRVQETKFLPEGVQPKTLLPTYRFFDDQRYFFSTEDVAKDFSVSLESLLSPFIITVRGKEHTIGFELCEDLWCEDYRKDRRALNPTKMLINNGAEKIINISASPWTYGKNAARDRRVQFLKKDIGKTFTPFYYVNCVGTQNNGKNIITFDGGSTVYNEEGLPLILGKSNYEEELIIVEEKDLQKRPIERVEQERVEQKYHALLRGIRHVKDMSSMLEQPRYIIGLSGGVDSAIVAALLTKAVGADNVMAINMPTRFNSDKTKDTARKIAENLGIGYEVVSIEELDRFNQELLERHDLDGSGRKLDARQKGNVAAKIRGTPVLSNLAAKYHALFTNNGNKLETALGYATLYGDVNGAFAPIADLTKPEIFELVEFFNTKVFRREVIPAVLIPDELFRYQKDQIAPTAELEKDQIDPMKFGYHDALLMEFTDFKKKSPEDIMQFYQEGKLHEIIGRNLGKNADYGYRLMERWGVNDPKVFVEDLAWFWNGIQGAVFKRIQTCPIIVTSKSAYGFDIRESILPFETSLVYDEIKEDILKMKKYTGGKNERT